VEILLWLVPPVVVTVVAMLWVGWVGRDRRELDREEAVRRMGAALEKDAPARRTPARRPHERSSGIAVRRTPEPEPQPQPEEKAPEKQPEKRPEDPREHQRRAS
jgi:hypothetical protein